MITITIPAIPAAFAAIVFLLFPFTFLDDDMKLVTLFGAVPSSCLAFFFMYGIIHFMELI